MKHSQHLNKLATAAIIPLVAVGFFVAMRAMEREQARPFVPEGTLVLANLRDESLTFFDFVDGTSVDVALAGPAHEMVAANGKLFVTMARKDAIAEVDIASRTVDRYLVLAGSPHGIATDGERLFVSLDDDNEVAVLDIRTLAESDRIETGDTPHAIQVVGDTLFVANSGDGTVSAIGNLGAVTREAGATPESLAVVGTIVAAADAGDDTLAVYQLPGMDRTALYAVGGRPVRVLPFEGRLLVARSRFGDVAVVDPESGELVAAVGIGRLTDGMCISPSGDWLAASANGDNRLSIVDTQSWRVSMGYETPDGPGTCLWLPAD